MIKFNSRSGFENLIFGVEAMSEENLILEQQMCFVMYACSKETIRRYKPYLDELGLTYTQYITLLVLWNEDNITVNELGKRLYLDSGTLTPLLKKLENNELVERTRDTRDERNVYVKLKEKAYTIKERAMLIPKKVLQGTGVSKEEASEIRDRLKSVLDRVK